MPIELDASHTPWHGYMGSVDQIFNILKADFDRADKIGAFLFMDAVHVVGDCNLLDQLRDQCYNNAHNELPPTTFSASSSTNARNLIPTLTTLQVRVS
jgi:hypothetical protein